MRIRNAYALPVLVAVAAMVSGCATPQVGEAQNSAPAKLAMLVSAAPPACPSKWIAAGNNGAKADRYVRVTCS